MYRLSVYTGRLHAESQGFPFRLRLPKQFRLKSKEVEIFRRGSEIVLRERSNDDRHRALELIAGKVGKGRPPIQQTPPRRSSGFDHLLW